MNRLNTRLARLEWETHPPQPPLFVVCASDEEAQLAGAEATKAGRHETTLVIVTGVPRNREGVKP